MQISDLVGQYSRNVSQGASIAAPATAVQQLADTVSELTAGQIFEGTVNELKKGEVILGLSNGQVLAAKIAGKLDLTQGQSMFFQVKSNNGSQVEIRPYLRGSLSNPTLLKALDAAGIPANERMVKMVNTMMEEQMPINKNSLWEMVKEAAAQPDIDVATIVQMKKLGIEVTPELANQFENYRQDQYAITSQMENFLEGLPEAFAGKELTKDGALALNGQILDTLLGISGEENPGQTEENQAQKIQAQDGKEAAVLSDGVALETVESKAQDAAKISGEAIPAENAKEVVEGAQQEENIEILVKSQEDYAPGTVGRTLTADQASQLEKQLSSFGEIAENGKLFADGKLNLELTQKEFLFELQKALMEAGGGESVKKLLSDKPYQTLLKKAVESEWMMNPKDVADGDKIKSLYQKLVHQMSRLEHVFEQAGMDKSQLAKAASDVRGNIDFMNQISQAYSYLQIPLKINGQNAHSDLYVYTNKKNPADKEGELTAFLHLDLDHLGSTDVSVRMLGKKVHTDFFLADDRSYALVMDHMDLLEERLLKKGYNCTISVQSGEKKMDFVEDFLKKDQPSTGRLHRYSFDVRA